MPTCPSSITVRFRRIRAPAATCANEDGKILIDGAPAECVGEGVTCSIADVPAFDGECAIGLPNAVCVTQHWAIRCDLDSGSPTPVDGGDGG